MDHTSREAIRATAITAGEILCAHHHAFVLAIHDAINGGLLGAFTNASPEVAPAMVAGAIECKDTDLDLETYQPLHDLMSPLYGFTVVLYDSRTGKLQGCLTNFASDYDGMASLIDALPYLTGQRSSTRTTIDLAKTAQA